MRALVCGASKGIGLAVAREFAVLGAEVVLLARDEAALQAAVAKLPHPERHKYLVQDLSSLQGLKASVEELLEREGDIGILVNNAGGPKAGPLIEAWPEEFLAGFTTHVLAAQVLVQSLLPGMKRLSYGRVLNVISTSVKIPIANLGVSNTVRGAMASWAKTLAMELGPMGITVNNVLPGYTSTERLEVLKAATAKRQGLSIEQVEEQWRESIPARRFAQPEEVAKAVAFLASPAAAYINGINLPVDGGRTGSL